MYSFHFLFRFNTIWNIKCIDSFIRSFVHSCIYFFCLLRLHIRCRLLSSRVVIVVVQNRGCRSAQWSEMYLCATVIGKDILCISDSVCTMWYKTGFKRSILWEYGMYWVLYSDKSTMSVWVCVLGVSDNSRIRLLYTLLRLHNSRTTTKIALRTVALFTWLSDLFAFTHSLQTHTHTIFYRLYRFF